MSLSNASQVLMRNTHLLSAKCPLFINMAEDGFIDAFIELNSHNNISCHNNNFIEYQEIKIKHGRAIKANFDSTYTTNLTHDLVIISFPKSKAELTFTLAMIANFLTDKTRVLFIGEKKGGVQSSPKLTKHFLTNCQKVDSARHCMLYAGVVKQEALNNTFTLNDWFEYYDVFIDEVKINVASLPGVFSQHKLDIGTALLLNNLPCKMTGKVLDFGCGGGVISSFIGKKFPETKLSLLDVSALALTSARKTLALNGLTGKIFASNSLSEVTDSYQHVVSNPPFHQGIKTHYQATEAFLANIKVHIKKSGCITIVANNFLRYQPIMKKYIGKTEQITNTQGFAIYHAVNNSEM